MIDYAERPWTKKYDPDVPATLEPYPAIPLHQFLRDSARKASDSIALITPAKVPLAGYLSRSITYGELDRLSDALAVGLIELGLKKGDRVAVILPNSAAMAISYFGILKAGGVVAATNPTYPPPKMQFQINDCDAEIVITLSLFYARFKQIQSGTKVKRVIVTSIKEYLPSVAKILFSATKEKKESHFVEMLASGDLWLQDILSKYANRKPDVDVKPSDIALFQYTGGTTGISKGAMLSHGAMVANMLQIQSWSNSLEKEAQGAWKRTDMLYLGAIPMFHSYGLVVLLSQAIASGSSIVLVANARDIESMVGIIQHYKPTVFLGVPAMYNAVVNHPDVKSGKVQMDSFLLSSSGAAPLPPATKREFENAGARRLNEGYGMSETAALAIANPLVGENRTGSVGLPAPDIDVRIVSLDDGITNVSVGEIGEIVMAGPNIMSGYHGMPTETTNTLREQDGKMWLFSGDIGYMDESGYFYNVDRNKDMALIGGFNV